MFAVRATLLLLLVAFGSSAHPGPGKALTSKVQVGYYAESLCPDCIAFSKGPMNTAINKVGAIFDLAYIPWGNARITADGQFECQHGKMECLINTVDACMLNYYPDRFMPPTSTL